MGKPSPTSLLVPKSFSHPQPDAHTMAEGSIRGGCNITAKVWGLGQEAKPGSVPSHTDTHTGSRTHRDFARIGMAASRGLADCPMGQTVWPQAGTDIAILHTGESIPRHPRFRRHGGSRSCPERPVHFVYAGNRSLDRWDRLARWQGAEAGTGRPARRSGEHG